MTDIDTFVAAKPGKRRNMPCPCNSGKKYKKCCEKLGEPVVDKGRMLRSMRADEVNEIYIPALIEHCEERL